MLGDDAKHDSVKPCFSVEEIAAVMRVRSVARAEAVKAAIKELEAMGFNIQSPKE